MSKRTSTRWYIGAWVVWLIAAIITVVGARQNPGAAVPPWAMVTALVMLVCGIVILVTWIGALVKLAQLHAWGWFAFLLIVHLIGLGIIPMIAYAAAGPSDEGGFVMRPTTT